MRFRRLCTFQFLTQKNLGGLALRWPWVFSGRGGWNTLGFERTTTSYGRLGPNERTRVAPLMDGRYRVTAYLGDKAKGGLVELALGEVDVRVVPGGQPVLLEVVGDGPAVRSAMQDVLRRQAEAAAAPGASAGR